MAVANQKARDAAKPWLPTTKAALGSVVAKLKRTDINGLFVLLVKAATSGDWATFIPAFEQASGMSGIGELLHRGYGPSMSMAYEQAGLPLNLQRLFSTAITVAWDACEQIKGIAPSRRLRAILLEKIFRDPDVRNLRVSQDILTALFA